MLLLILLFVCGLVTFDDMLEFWDGIFNVKYGQLRRMQYFGCTWASTIIIAFLGSIFLSRIILADNAATKGFEFYLAYGILYLIITLVELSAFLRRMNDAKLSHWYALVFLIPGIGNIVGFIIALMPSDFGSPY